MYMCGLTHNRVRTCTRLFRYGTIRDIKCSLMSLNHSRVFISDYKCYINHKFTQTFLRWLEVRI